MLVAGVVQHQVEEKTHAPCVCFFQEPVEILHRAEVRHDLPVIADVVAVVGVGGCEDRIEPQGFDSQPMQVVEFFGDSVQVPDAVVVAVLETAGIDLIDDRFFPPGFLQGRGWRSEYGHIVQDSVIRSQDKKKRSRRFLSEEKTTGSQRLPVVRFIFLWQSDFTGYLPGGRKNETSGLFRQAVADVLRADMGTPFRGNRDAVLLCRWRAECFDSDIFRIFQVEQERRQDYVPPKILGQ